VNQCAGEGVDLDGRFGGDVGHRQTVTVQEA
jgi:hypothetical protein